jgi:hypothetical protein
MDVERRDNGEERDRFDKALEIAAVEAARRAARRAAGGYFAFVLIVLVGAVFYQRSVNADLDTAARRAAVAAHTAAVTAARVDSAELRACERLQVQRERTNVSEARQYLLLVAVTKSPRASRMVRDRYGALARTTLYDPPTDCREAVSRPNTYRRPRRSRSTRCPRRTWRAWCRRRRRSGRSRHPRARRPMPHRLIGAAYVAVIVGGGWAANNYSSEQRSEEKLRSSETSCLQVGNPGRALDRLEADGNILQRRERVPADRRLPPDLLRQ